MGDLEGKFKDLDQNIAANVRAYREAAGISQDELAQRMVNRGFGFSQATIWKIESAQRPVRASEMVALADALETFFPVTALIQEPEATRHTIRLRAANAAARDTYGALKAAAAAYLEAQVDLLYAARRAHDEGFVVTELHTSWLTIPPEEAVFVARVEARSEAEHIDQLNDEVDKIKDALRSSGYKPNLHIGDITYGGGEPLPVWTPDGEGTAGSGHPSPQ